MNRKTRVTPTISELFEEFFGSYKPTAPRALRDRIDLVRTHLTIYLEAEGPGQLTTPQVLILEAERSFDPQAAFARTMHAPELYFTLTRYLGPDGAMPGDLQRDAQLDVVAALASFLWSARLISLGSVSECDIIEFDIAMERARNVRRRSPSQ